MYKKRRIFVFVLFCLAICISIFYIMKKNSPLDTQTSCITTFDIDHYTWITWSITREKIQKQDIFLAAPMTDASRLIDVEKLSGNIVVNELYFSDITKTDATRISEPTVIWTYKQLSFTDYTPREVIAFLLTSQLITTYRHLESHLCLTKETDTKTTYTADFDASHKYCTNECVTEKYRFSIEINKATGTMGLITK